MSRFRCETGGKVSTVRYNGCYQLICEYFRRKQEVSHVTSAAAANTLVCRGVTFIRQGNWEIPGSDSRLWLCLCCYVVTHFIGLSSWWRSSLTCQQWRHWLLQFCKRPLYVFPYNGVSWSVISPSLDGVANCWTSWSSFELIHSWLRHVLLLLPGLLILP